MKGWVDYLGDWLHTKMVYPPTDVTHPSTNPAAHGREMNSRPVDHKYGALTIAPPRRAKYVDVKKSSAVLQCSLNEDCVL